jgi:predicted CXXCH cytochrome family protein
MTGGASVHPPVEDGECTSCHSPHGSSASNATTRCPEGLPYTLPWRTVSALPATAPTARTTRPSW